MKNHVFERLSEAKKQHPESSLILFLIWINFGLIDLAYIAHFTYCYLRIMRVLRILQTHFR